MSDSDVNAILLRLTAFEATVTTQLAGIATENARGENVHKDHEARLRSLEAVRWKVAGWAAALGALGGGGIAASLSKVVG